jgi:hypothetical protein
MNWDAVGAISELVGAFAVVITLIYLAIQVRQNTRAIRLDTGHAITEEFRSMFAMMAENKDLAELVHRAASDPASISGADKVRYYGLNGNFVRALENAYIQWTEGALDARHWAGMKRMLTDYAQLPGFREFWPFRKHWFSEDFQQFMDTEILPSNESVDVPLPGDY